MLLLCKGIKNKLKKEIFLKKSLIVPNNILLFEYNIFDLYTLI